MIGLKPRQGSRQRRPGNGKAPAALWKQGGRALRRYLLISTGISSTALGLALIVSFFAASYGAPSAATSMALGSVEVSQLEGRSRVALLDPALLVVAPQVPPPSDTFAAASPAPPLDVEKPAPTPTPPPPAAPTALTPPASPPAATLDQREEPLDEAAAALPLPLLAQDEAAEEQPVQEVERALVAPPGGMPNVGPVHGVNVTFYDCLVQGFCGDMYNGEPVYEGAAACSWDLPLGTRFVIENDPTGRTYVCADRGLLADTWVDIFFYSPEEGWAWQQSVGRFATILILSVPPFDPPS